MESYNRSATERREGEEKERQIGRLSSQSLRQEGDERNRKRRTMAKYESGGHHLWNSCGSEAG